MINIDYIQTIKDPTIKTVGVKYTNNPDIAFITGQQEYTYKTDLNLSIGDFVITTVIGNEKQVKYKLALVTRIDEDPEIFPEDTIRYRWIVQAVNTEEHKEADLRDKNFRTWMRRVERRRHKEETAKALTEKYGDILEIESEKKDDSDTEK
jgi:hypothetical protein